MEVKLLRPILIWFAAAALYLAVPAAVNSAPITIDFNVCVPAVFPVNPTNLTGPSATSMCCPLKPTKPIIDGPPRRSTNRIRVRKASQCTDAAYAAKLDKAYALMRALPEDDPRSLQQQWYLHCAYCGGSFLTKNSSGGSEGIDIHFSWLFYPWHRWYLYFHERILQSLLRDPSFSLNYWNWDSPYTVGDSSKSKHKGEACLKQGHYFPAAYRDPSSATYDTNRSLNAKGNGRLPFPSFFYVPAVPEALQPNNTATEEAIIASNMNIMYQALVSGGTTAETFMGRPYRAGDKKGFAGPLSPEGVVTGGSGSLESSAHATVHFWTGGDPPSLDDMGQLAHSSRDPVFYAHHSNIDRLFQVWKDIGPIVGQTRAYYSDPDFLNAEFLFYDENKDLRRVKVGDALDTKNLGYVYQQANDASWIFPDLTRCSKLGFWELLAQAKNLPVPQKSRGNYHLQAGKPFVLVIERPDNPNGVEEFLTIDRIKLDRSSNAGFDVYVDLPNPSDYPVPTQCAEYNGRFTNMAQTQGSSSKPLVWKQSVTKTFADIQAPADISEVVITLIPFSKYGGYETIQFKSITINT